MIVQAAVLVPGDDEHAIVPDLVASPNGFVHPADQIVSFADVGVGVLIVLRKQNVVLQAGTVARFKERILRDPSTFASSKEPGCRIIETGEELTAVLYQRGDRGHSGPAI